jgi:hypothetical protein
MPLLFEDGLPIAILMRLHWRTSIVRLLQTILQFISKNSAHLGAHFLYLLLVQLHRVQEIQLVGLLFVFKK